MDEAIANKIAELEATVSTQHAQLVWLTAAVKQIQAILSPPSGPGKQYVMDDNRTEVGLGPMPSASKASFI